MLYELISVKRRVIGGCPIAPACSDEVSAYLFGVNRTRFRVGTRALRDSNLICDADRAPSVCQT
jgi:hypothetical protein